MSEKIWKIAKTTTMVSSCTLAGLLFTACLFPPSAENSPGVFRMFLAIVIINYVSICVMTMRRFAPAGWQDRCDGNGDEKTTPDKNALPA
ncbi:hypothetical protein Pan258_42170 [Symmachiella dynata]|nr:hypothetical protein Pan258_42170 [Symmachiella dynata]